MDTSIAVCCGSASQKHFTDTLTATHTAAKQHLPGRQYFFKYQYEPKYVSGCCSKQHVLGGSLCLIAF